jgi:hypothetical protein
LPTEAPGPESRGFIRVGSTEPALWMRCESCGRADDFWLDTAVGCGCGARYGFALRPDGAKVPLSELRFVPFAQGPVALASMEWDWTALALVGVLVVGTISILTIGWLR